MKLKRFVLKDSIKVLDLKTISCLKGGNGNGNGNGHGSGGVPPPIKGLSTGGII